MSTTALHAAFLRDHPQDAQAFARVGTTHDLDAGLNTYVAAIRRPRPEGYVLTLPGHDSFAESADLHWRENAEAHNWTTIGVQLWRGGNDYLTPEQSRDACGKALSWAKGKRALLHGFSRSATLVPWLLLKDTGKVWTGGIVESGGVDSGYRPWREVLDGGPAALAGRRIVVTSGELDTNAGKSDPATMARTAGALQEAGAEVLFISGPWSHGGFLESERVGEALAFVGAG